MKRTITFTVNDRRQVATSVAVTPNDAGNWLRLARAIVKIQPTADAGRALMLERAGTAHIAYHRSNDAAEEADSLVILGRTFADRKLWRPALDALRQSLELREVADVRPLYEQARNERGFRILDYSVDSDDDDARVCFQFSEQLASKPRISRRSWLWPDRTSRHCRPTTSSFALTD